MSIAPLPPPFLCLAFFFCIRERIAAIGKEYLTNAPARWTSNRLALFVMLRLYDIVIRRSPHPYVVPQWRTSWCQKWDRTQSPLTVLFAMRRPRVVGVCPQAYAEDTVQPGAYLTRLTLEVVSVARTLCMFMSCGHYTLVRTICVRAVCSINGVNSLGLIYLEVCTSRCSVRSYFVFFFILFVWWGVAWERRAAFPWSFGKH